MLMMANVIYLWGNGRRAMRWENDRPCLKQGGEVLISLDFVWNKANETVQWKHIYIVQEWTWERDGVQAIIGNRNFMLGK